MCLASFLVFFCALLPAFLNQFLHNIYDHFINRIFLKCGRPLHTLTKYVVTWRRQQQQQQQQQQPTLYASRCSQVPGTLYVRHNGPWVRCSCFLVVPYFLPGTRYKQQPIIYAPWYSQVPGTPHMKHKGPWVRCPCIVLSLTSCLGPGMKTISSSLFFVPCFLQVNLYLYIPLHTIYSRTYIVQIQQCGTRWFEPVIPVTPGAIEGHITTKLHELKTALDAGRGGWNA